MTSNVLLHLTRSSLNSSEILGLISSRFAFLEATLRNVNEKLNPTKLRESGDKVLFSF